MIPPTHVTDRHRSTGAVAAYRRAVLTLVAATVLSFLVTRFVLARDWLRWYIRHRPTVLWRDAALTRSVSWEGLGVDPTAALVPELLEFLVSWLTFEPMLAFLIGGGVVSVVARYHRPFRTWLDDVQLV